MSYKLKSLSHFGHDVRVCSKSQTYMQLSSFPAPLAEKDCLSHFTLLPPLSKTDSGCVSLFLGSLSAPFCHIPVFVPITHWFDHCSFVSLTSPPPTPGLLWQFWVFHFPYTFLDYLFQFCEKCYGSYYICRLLWAVLPF